MEIQRPEQRVMAAALELRSARGELLAENVANADTPGYVSKDLRFDDALSSVVESDDGQVDPHEVAQEQIVRQDQRADGNDVDVNRALANVYENSIKYIATLKLYGDSVNRLTTATSST